MNVNIVASDSDFQHCGSSLYRYGRPENVKEKKCCALNSTFTKKRKWWGEVDKKCKVKWFEKRSSRKIRLKGVTRELLFVTIHLFTRKITFSEMKYLTYSNFSTHTFSLRIPVKKYIEIGRFRGVYEHESLFSHPFPSRACVQVLRQPQQIAKCRIRASKKSWRKGGRRRSRQERVGRLIITASRL